MHVFMRQYAEIQENPLLFINIHNMMMMHKHQKPFNQHTPKLSAIQIC